MAWASPLPASGCPPGAMPASLTTRQGCRWGRCASCQTLQVGVQPGRAGSAQRHPSSTAALFRGAQMPLSGQLMKPQRGTAWVGFLCLWLGEQTGILLNLDVHNRVEAAAAATGHSGALMLPT